SSRGVSQAGSAISNRKTLLRTGLFCPDPAVLQNQPATSRADRQSRSATAAPVPNQQAGRVRSLPPLSLGLQEPARHDLLNGTGPPAKQVAKAFPRAGLGATLELAGPEAQSMAA